LGEGWASEQDPVTRWEAGQIGDFVAMWMKKSRQVWTASWGAWTSSMKFSDGSRLVGAVLKNQSWGIICFDLASWISSSM
jgi:hypothetical protein